jgi:hypothetical protein
LLPLEVIRRGLVRLDARVEVQVAAIVEFHQGVLPTRRTSSPARCARSRREVCCGLWDMR